MTQPWPAQRLADAANETPERLAWYASVGLLHRKAGDERPRRPARDALPVRGRTR